MGYFYAIGDDPKFLLKSGRCFFDLSVMEVYRESLPVAEARLFRDREIFMKVRNENRFGNYAETIRTLEIPKFDKELGALKTTLDKGSVISKGSGLLAEEVAMLSCRFFPKNSKH